MLYIIPPIYVPVEKPLAYEKTIHKLFSSVFKASFTTKNQTVISANPIKLAIKFFPLTEKIVLTVPNDTSIILTKNIFKHKNKSIISPLI